MNIIINYFMADSFIVNELLAFTFHKYNSDTHAAIQNTLLTCYCDNDISEAQTMLHHHYEDVIGLRPARQNRGTQINQGEICYGHIRCNKKAG